MRPRWVLAALLLPLVSLGGVRDAVAFKTGQEFLAECQEGVGERQTMLHLQCLAYLHGFMDAYQVSAVFQRQRAGPPLPICLPEKRATVGAVVDVTRGWLRRHPHRHHEPVAVAIFWALVEAYPCESWLREK
jgi:hypothetical protein